MTAIPSGIWAYVRVSLAEGPMACVATERDYVLHVTMFIFDYMNVHLGLLLLLCEVEYGREGLRKQYAG